MIFWIFILLIVLQRVTELFIAKRNEKWVLEQGGYEVGNVHYKYILLLHILFFLSLIYEVSIFDRGIIPFGTLVFVLFVFTQMARIWAIRSLGKLWNTKILILPAQRIVTRGPYRYMKHPNYLIVALEFILIPLFFQAYITAAMFSLLNFLVLSIRIPVEEKALQAYSQKE